MFKAEAPDKRHSFASTKVPQKSKIVDDTIEEDQRCRNPRCQKRFSIYWFDLKMNINRV